MISVILPVLNAARTLPDQLAALAGQTFKGTWELLVADNGSTDAGPDLVRSWEVRLPLKFVDASGTPGGAAARNLAATRARGEVLACCDADDVVDRGWLEALEEATREHEFVAGALDYSALNPHAPGWKREMLARPTRWLGRIPFADSANLAVRKTAFNFVGGFDASLATVYDIDFSLRLLRAGHQLHFAPDAIVAKRMRREVKAIWKQSVRWGKDDVVVYKRHRDAPSEAGGVRANGIDYLRNVASYVRKFPASLTSTGRVSWLEFAGRHYGRVQGSISERTFLP